MVPWYRGTMVPWYRGTGLNVIVFETKLVFHARATRSLRSLSKCVASLDGINQSMNGH